MQRILYEPLPCFVLCALVFCMGACIFSFLNVIVYRVPRNMSFVKGHSICPACGRQLRAPDLVPIFSYLLLRGKCRYCGAKIGVRDTLTEALGGALAVICLLHFSNVREAVLVFLFLCVLTVVAFLDIDTMEIADGCHIAILALALLAHVLLPGVSWRDSVVGMLCVSVPMLLVSLAVPGAFGGGDIKLMAACGLFLGWKMTLVSAFLGILAGGVYGIWLLASGKKGRRDHFALGPFLCLGMLAGVLYGRQILDWYLGYLIW